MTSTATAPAPAGYHDGRVQIGHDAATGEPADYVARIDRRVCNGLISGGYDGVGGALVDRITADLRDCGEWTVRVVDAAAHDAVQLATTALTDAEHHMRRNRGRSLLLVWSDFAALAHQLRGTSFLARVTTLAEYGPDYGVAQLVHARALRRAAAADDARLRNLLVDNLIALRGDDLAEYASIAGCTIAPTTLQVGSGHAYLLVGHGDLGRHVLHVHLDHGRPISECPTCWHAATTAATAAPDVAWDPATGHLACRDAAGDWRHLQYVDGPALDSIQVADLRRYPGLGAR